MGRLSDLQDREFDVAIVGGGIVGCGIARDAALRGLSVALVEKQDFGSGTTSASTRIVHGGLRYLEMLDFRLVRLDLRERETLLKIAPHLVRPLEFLIPFLGAGRLFRLKIRMGLALYDALSFDKVLPSRRWLSVSEARRTDDALGGLDVQGAAAYHDARVDSPERLALENVLDAERQGARALNYCEAVSAIVSDEMVRGLRVRDLLSGAETDVRCRIVVNATGAWLDLVNHALTLRRTNALRTTKGVHAVCPPLTSRALVLFSRVDGRLVFAIPRKGLTWIGTTDTDYSGDPDAARATRSDVEYLVASVQHVFPGLRIDDVLFTTAGVRALVRQPGAASAVSRMHRIVHGEPLAPSGMISVLGGKITGYRAIAEDVTDLVCSRLGMSRRPSLTSTRPLPGAEGAALGPVARGAATPPHLYDLYGVRAEEVVALARSEAGLDRQLSSNCPVTAAEVVHAVRHEHCFHLSDFLKRRTLLGATADQGACVAEPVARLIGTELGWPEEVVRGEIEAYRTEIAESQAFRSDHA